MNSTSRQYRSSRCTYTACLALMASAFAVFAGCAKPNLGPAGSTEDAESLLTVALDSWKAGMTPDELLTDDPAVHIADEDWQAGTVLKDYSVAGPAVKFGGTWRVPALLTLSTPDRPELKKKAAYEVTMAPHITILRSDENVD